MNPLLQPEVHPDAESLNAFVERALPQPERAQIVAHLGGCARCREVVFLAQAAAELDAPPLAVIKTESALAQSGQLQWRARIANWRIALIPAAALATAAGLLVWVQFKSAPPAPAVAQVSRPSPMASSDAPPVPRAAQAAVAASAAPPVAVQPKAARAEHKISQSQDKKTLSLPAVAPSKAPDGFGADGNLLSMARQADAQKGLVTSAVPPVPASGNAQWNSEAAAQDRRSALARRASEMNAGIISKLAIEAPPPPAPVPPDLTAVHGDLMAPATGGPRPLAAEADASRQMERMPQPVNGLAVLHLTRQPRLPSGLDAVSSAVMLDRILAVDPEGAVFLSRDATKHWERVPIQWTGKAIAVRAPEFYPLNAAVQNDAALHTSPIASVSITPAPPVPAPAAPPLAGQSPATPPAGSAPPAPPPAPADAKAALAVPGMLFKLINDHRQTWVSADGKVWHEQQGSE